MMAGTFAADGEKLEAVCQNMVRTNDPKLPLMRAAADGRIALAWVFDGSATWPFKAVEAVQLPVVVLVGDDPYPDGHSKGPNGWKVAKPLKAWARAVIVHGAGAEHHHYKKAVLGARYTGRCAMIETSSSRALQWSRFLACPRTLMILPPAGLSHPTPSSQETMQ